MDFTVFEEIPDDTYEVVYADPPWIYYGDQNKMGAAGKEYELMEDGALAKLPVRAKCRKKAVLFMWATCPRLNAAMTLLLAWGFHFRGVAFVWVKTRKDGKPIGAQGVRPSIVKPTTELVLVGSTEPDPEEPTELVIVGSTMPLGRPLPLLDEGVSQVVLAPKRKHSEKPEEVRRRIDLLYGDRPKLELFARGAPVRSWDRFGNEMEPETPTILDRLNEKAP